MNEHKTELSENFNQQDLKEILTSKSRAVYLSYDTLNPNFGTIILLDLISKKSVKLYDNRFYNSNPIFFEGGDKILFASAQIGDPYKLRVVKYHSWQQLYILDCNDLYYETYFHDNLESGQTEINKFTGISWDSYRKQVYFSNDDNNIYKLQDGNKQPKLLYELDKDYKVWHIELSPNKQYIAIQYVNLNKIDFGICIYDLSSNKVANDIKSTDKFIALLGWSFDNNLYYNKDSLVVFNFNSNSIKPLNLNLNKNDFSIKKIYAEDNHSIILFIDKMQYNSVVKYYVATSTEIARFNFQSQKIEWLTNDGSKKKDLNVYILPSQ